MYGLFRIPVILAVFCGQALVLQPGVQASVAVDINEAGHLKLRFEQLPVLVGDPGSLVTVPLDVVFPGSESPWRGLEFGSLSPGGTGYRAMAISGGGVELAVAEFRLDDATFNPLATLPISGDPGLAQVWAPVSGMVTESEGTAPIAYTWDVNQSVGAGFGLFGTFEAFVVPEPRVGLLLGMGVGLGVGLWVAQGCRLGRGRRSGGRAE
ncbi:MAG: hypothetical protein AB7O66_01655 [Limisphaerales bacterium]